MTRQLRYSMAILAMTFFIGQCWLLLAQSAPTAGGRETLRPLRLRLNRGLPVNSHTGIQATTTAGSYSDAVALGLAGTKVYQFRSVDYPGATDSFLQDYNEKVAVGDFNVPNAGFNFYFDGTAYHILKVPHSTDSIVDGINASGQMVGAYVTLGEKIRGFLYDGTKFVTLNFPHSHGTYANGINDSGLIVGSYLDSNNAEHGFVFKAGVFTRLDFPGATQTVAWGINSTGKIVGYYDISGGGGGFLFEKGVYYPIEFPNAKSTSANGINDAGTIAGSFNDASGQHGFIYSAGTYTQVDVPGAANTTLYRIKNNGSVAGYLQDSLGEFHGIIGH